jgi:hypothetical protein
MIDGGKQERRFPARRLQHVIGRPPYCPLSHAAGDRLRSEERTAGLPQIRRVNSGQGNGGHVGILSQDRLDER